MLKRTCIISHCADCLYYVPCSYLPHFILPLTLGFVATLGIWEWAQFARFKIL